MRNKRNYSLTAKERKQKRYADMHKNDPKKEEISQRETEERAMVSAQKRSRRSAVIVGAVACIAIIMIIVALIVPVITYMINPYRDMINPATGKKYVIARFDLSNEMVLEYIIEEDEYDIAATNFIFLAKNGYFDNVVFFDAGNAAKHSDGWLRFGGYEEQPTQWIASTNDYKYSFHHSRNEAFCSNFTALPNEKFDKVTNKFGYELYADSGLKQGRNGEDPNRLGDVGVLAFLYDKTSTEFQMSYKENASDQADVVTGNPETLKSTMVGYALNDATIQNVQKIASTAAAVSRATSGVRWYPPDPTIRIKTVKVYNLDPQKWDNFDFISYMTGTNANGDRLRNWRGRS